MENTTKMPGLKPLQITDNLLLREYLLKYPRENCDYSLTNLMVWGLIYGNHYLIYKERLVIFNLKYQFIFFPIGEELNPIELSELVNSFRKYYPNVQLILVPAEYLMKFPYLIDDYYLHEDRDWSDYVYSIDSLVNLSGKKLAKKKNLISQFTRAYPQYKVLKISEDRLDVILQFTQKWRRERSVGGSYLDTEYQAIENTVKYWNQLPVEGIIICLDQKIAAYSIFSPQTVDMVTEHFEKFDPDKKGSAQLINWETARYLQGRFKWINREQDIGLDGLRQAKLSYVPDRLLPYYALRPKTESSWSKAE